MINRSIAPPANPIGNIHFIMPEVNPLDNEILIHSFNLASQDVINIELVFHCGYWDSIENPLIAKFTPKMLLEGTTSKTAKEISEIFDFYGAYLHITTGLHYTTISLAVLTEKLPQVLPLFEEIIKNPSFPESEFETMRKNAHQKFLIKSKENGFVARNKFYRSLFGMTHPYGRETEEGDYKSINIDEIKNFYQKYFSENNCQIFIAGGFDESEVFSLLNNVFGKNWRKSSKPVHHYDISPEDKYLHVEKPEALQSAIKIGCVTINKHHPDYPKLQVANMMLGGFFGSRLMKNIREDKGYTYGIYSSVISYLQSGIFSITTETGVEYTQNTIQEIYNEIHRLQNGPITPDELKLVKNYILGHLLKNFDGVFEINQRYKDALLSNLEYPTYYEQFIKTVKQITTEEIQFMAQKYFDTSK
ncbi:MAG: insulinase family protein, partial [Bacteroidetes bacterium]